MLTNLVCPVNRGGMVMGLHYGTEIYTKDRLGVMVQKAEKMLLKITNEWLCIVHCATFSKSLNPRNISKSVPDIRIRIRFPFESSFWIFVSGCKLTILPDIQPANRIVIISDTDGYRILNFWNFRIRFGHGYAKIFRIWIRNWKINICSVLTSGRNLGITWFFESEQYFCNYLSSQVNLNAKLRPIRLVALKGNHGFEIALPQGDSTHVVLHCIQL